MRNTFTTTMFLILSAFLCGGKLRAGEKEAQGHLAKVTIFSVWTPDPEKSFRWYQNSLGLVGHNLGEVPGHAGEKWLILNVPNQPELIIALKKGTARPNETLFGLQTNDLSSLTDELKTRGVNVPTPTRLPYGTEIDLRDPDGQVISIVQPND